MNYLAIDTSGNNLTIIIEYNGKKVLLVKPKIDTRDGETII